MNVIEKLIEKIKEEKETKSRAIVFWYDAQVQVDIDELKEQLNEVEVRYLNDRNFFQMKIEIEFDKPDQSFLLYSDTTRPDDSENMLLDILLYSTEFKADETALLSETLQVSDNVLRPFMERYPLFFDSKDRKTKLAKILPHQSEQDLFELSMIAVLTKATVPDIRLITHQLLLEGLYVKENELIKQIKRNFSLERTFEIIGRYFGISLEYEEEPLLKLLNVLIYQHFKRNANFSINEWEDKWASSSPNVCALFIEEWLQRHDKEVLEEKIKEWERVNRVREVLSRQDIINYKQVDTFPVVDALIIEKCIDELYHQTIHLSERQTLIEQRLQTHWGSQGQLRAIYDTLNEVIRIERLKSKIDRMYHEEDLYESYASYLYEVDQAYRRFLHNFSKLDSKEMLDEIATKLTNWYENKFLLRISEKMNYMLEEGKASKLMSQRKFFAQIIRPILEKEQTRVFVIISDALRYEAGHELYTYLAERENGTSTIQPMVASYPTYTQLGMASILPHKNLTVDDSKVVYADGKSTKGWDYRERIFQSVEPQTEVIKLSNLLDMKYSEAEKVLRGKRLVILHHDHIDALGDSMKSERETYEAVHHAIQYLNYAVERLSRLQAKRIFITADHGFLFQFKQIKEYGKIPAVEGHIIDGNRRFAIGYQLSVPEGAIKLKEEQTPLKDVEVVLAKGLNRFKTGGGLQFIHGGALPQEAVVPLIDYRRTEKAQPVDIVVAMIQKVITNYRVPITFYQEQSVSDGYTSRKVRATFYQGNERISNEVELVFDLKGENKDRNRQVEFSLIEKHYKIGEPCTLRVQDVTKKGIEPYLEEEFVLRLYEVLY